MNFAIVRGLLFVGLTGCNYITSTLGKSIRMNNSGLLTGNYVSAIGDTKLVIIYCGRSEKSSFFFTFEIFVQIEFSFFFFFFRVAETKSFPIRDIVLQIDVSIPAPIIVLHFHNSVLRVKFHSNSFFANRNISNGHSKLCARQEETMKISRNNNNVPITSRETAAILSKYSRY